nr:ribonuclease H-like domain-containing protein [Tanacetum cinerariifolium]
MITSRAVDLTPDMWLESEALSVQYFRDTLGNTFVVEPVQQKESPKSTKDVAVKKEPSTEVDQPKNEHISQPEHTSSRHNAMDSLDLLCCKDALCVHTGKLILICHSSGVKLALACLNLLGLDLGNPLYLHANDSNCASICSVKLTGVDNYRIWASAMKLALQIKHKMGFITGTCVRTDYLASAPLLEQWDSARLEVANYDKMLKLMQFLMGLDDIYQPIRSSILTREVLPEAKDAFLIISREESHKRIPSSSGTVKNEKAQASAFVSKQSDMNKSRNNNWSNNGNNVNRGVYDNLLCKCFEFIGYPPGFKRNPNLKPNINGNSKSNSGDFRKESSNNSETKTSGNVSFTNEQVMMLKSLLNDKGSAGQSNMADSKFNIGFDETKYYIQGLKKGRVLGTGSEFGGLYLFDKEYNKSTVANNSKFVSCFVSKEVWHCRLGHHANQVLKLLNSSLNLSNIDHEGPCELCHKAKQTSDSFPLSENKSIIFGQLMHLDVWGPYKVINREWFRYFLTIVDDYSSPNDDEEGSSCRDGSVHQSGPSHSLDQSKLDEHIPTSGSGSDLQGSRNDGLVTATPIDENTKEVNLIKSSRTTKLPAKFNEYVLDNKVKYGLNRYANHTHLDSQSRYFIYNLNKTLEPSSFEEASKDPNWICATNDEMNALYENDTWYLVDLPSGTKPIGSKWVFKIKYKSDGEVDRFKARVVAKGFGQKEGLDYEETFSPVVKMETVRCLLSLAVQNEWEIYQMDINNAFLYGDLIEEVYMLPPPGFFDPSNKRVCKLKKSLYGLKQAPRKWNQKLCETLKENGFEQSKNDHSFFFKNNEKISLFLLVYVDDIIVTGTSKVEIAKFKHFLSNRFRIKDLGELKYFLGIEVLKVSGGLCLSQLKYCLELLHDFGLLACRLVLTPLLETIILGHKETEKDKFLVKITNYQRLIGKLIYLTLTRPDISYAVHCLSQHMHAPLKSHFDIALRLLKYLKLALGFGVQSVSSYCMFVNGCLVSWKSKKQVTLSKSSAEDEYRSMAAATCEIMRIVKIMSDLNIKNLLPAELYCDNKAAIEKVCSGLIKTVKVESKDNVADILTKAIGSFQHGFLTKKLEQYNFLDYSVFKMEKHENAPPIQTTLNGPNYLEWSKAMRSFLKGKKCWRYVTGDITTLEIKPDESNDKF